MKKEEKISIKMALKALVENLNSGKLFGTGVKKLKGKWKGFLRMRVSDLRIIFKLRIREKVIFVSRVGKRKTVYR